MNKGGDIKVKRKRMRVKMMKGGVTLKVQGRGHTLK